MNKITLIGNLTSNPEKRSTSRGTSVTSFTIAVNRRFANQQGVREADFFNIVCWRQTAEFCSRYLSKGRKIAVEGSLQTRSYDAQDGSKRFVTEVIADNVEFCDRSPEASQGGAQGFTPATGETARQAEAMFGQQPEYIDDDQLPF